MNKTEQLMSSFLVTGALLRGWSVSVRDDITGEGQWTVIRSHDAKDILDAMATTEGDMLCFYDLDGSKVGTVWLAYGNGADLIFDMTAHPCEALDDFVGLVDQVSQLGTDHERRLIRKEMAA